MKDFGEKLEKKWAVEYSEIKDTIQEITQPRLLCLEDEDEQLKEQLH